MTKTKKSIAKTIQVAKIAACVIGGPSQVQIYIYIDWIDRLIDRWMDRWMDGWMDGWMDEWMDGWMDGWMDRYIMVSQLTKAIEL